MTKARDNANGGLGLILIKPSSVVNGTDNGKGTISFSAASSVSLNDVFNSTYDNYLIKVNQTGSGGVTMAMRLRVSGSDNSSSVYRTVGLYHYTAAPTVVGTEYNPTSYFWIGECRNGLQGNHDVLLNRPFETAYTSMRCHAIYDGGSSTSGENLMTGSVNVTTSYTGFTLLPASGTISGTVSVYGYNK